MASCSRQRRLSQRRGGHIALLVLVLLAFALRTVPLGRHRFHPDEALYASLALRTADDPALISEHVDKPPLHIYFLAAMFRVFGPSEIAARLPNLFAATVCVASLHALGKSLYDRRTALAAAALYAVSPFALLFAPTAFTDPLLVLWGVLALWCAAKRKSLWAGVALGLAYATKQQSVLLAPLILVVGIGGWLSVASGRTRPLVPLLRGAAGFALPFSMVTWWDSLRWQLRPSFWDRSLTTYGGLNLVAVSSWPGRLAEWTKLLSYVFASPSLSVLLGVGLALQIGLAARGRRLDRRARWDLLFAGYAVVYVVLHTIVSFQVWDRYLLPLVPLLCLLLARTLMRFEPLFLGALRRVRLLNASDSARFLTAGLLAGLLVRPACLGAGSRLPVGGDHGAYDGIDHLTAYLQEDLPNDSILYYHWLGWHYDYHLHGAPFQRVWYTNAEELGDRALRDPSATKAIVFPDWRDDMPVRRALAERGMALIPRFSTYRRDGSRSFVLYRIKRAVDPALVGAGS